MGGQTGAREALALALAACEPEPLAACEALAMALTSCEALALTLSACEPEPLAACEAVALALAACDGNNSWLPVHAVATEMYEWALALAACETLARASS